MTNEQQKAKELAKLLTAFADGKQLQYQTENLKWFGATSLMYIADSVIDNKRQIRIKPETKRIVYNLNDELVGKVVIQNNKSSVVKRLILSQDRISVLISDYQNYTKREWYTYEQLSEFFTFDDNSPCYKEVECE